MRFPLHRVAAVHLSGGVWIGRGQERRLLDDHLHDPPAAVYGLLARLAEHVPQPLTVILERDGHFPDFTALLAQLELARDALCSGRRSAAESRLCHERSAA
jgi:uncharacterized protein (UPF0276 family)